MRQYFITDKLSINIKSATTLVSLARLGLLVQLVGLSTSDVYVNQVGVYC